MYVDTLTKLHTAHVEHVKIAKRARVLTQSMPCVCEVRSTPVSPNEAFLARKTKTLN